MNDFKQEWNAFSRKWRLLTTYINTVQRVLKRDELYKTDVLVLLTDETLHGSEEEAMNIMDLINGLLALKEPLPTVDILMENFINETPKVTSRLEVFEYLDELRETGVTNMFGARPYLEKAFNFSSKEAADWLSEWMRTFEERHSEEK